MKADNFLSFSILLLSLFFQSCSSELEYDVIIRNAVIFDGTGNTPVKGDIGINKDTIAFIGDLKMNKGKKEFDAKGLAISPGFVNMLSWATVSLLADGRCSFPDRAASSKWSSGIEPHRKYERREASSQSLTFGSFFKGEPSSR